MPSVQQQLARLTQTTILLIAHLRELEELLAQVSQAELAAQKIARHAAAQTAQVQPRLLRPNSVNDLKPVVRSRTRSAGEEAPNCVPLCLDLNLGYLGGPDSLSPLRFPFLSHV